MTRERIPEGLRERGTRLWKETTDVLDLEAHEELTLLEGAGPLTGSTHWRTPWRTHR